MPAAILLALVLTLLMCGLLVLINTFEHVNNTTLALFFLMPVGIAASLWGLFPGATAAFVSFLAFNFFFIPDLYTFQVKQTEDLIVLAAFLAVAFVLSELTGRVRRNLYSATTREYEAKRLYELNTMLTGTQDERATARIILEKIDQTLHPSRAEILIESSPNPVFLARGVFPETVSAKKPFVVPLQTSRELIGEIRVWSDVQIQEAEERLLNIFASQGVLTIERIRLGEDARKTRVLEESDRLKTSLLSSVSHELRSPLAAIKASVSSLRTEEVEWDSEARKELLTTVEEEIDHLNILVGNLLDMSRIEAGVLKPQKKPNILAEIIATVISRMRPQFQNLNVLADVSEDLPLVDVDYVQMQQVFTNLFANSLKYSPPGSTIKINAVTNGTNYVLVGLKNQSLPVPEADMERIFEKFYRINPSDKVTGAGLGLSICKGIIEAHGGRIWVENQDDGITFNFTLPVVSHG
jgi:two-component system sensor histidine kinase KdpD